ncbi:hypothetical protein TNCV_884231 [Trichonephila clavipes]|nr:hypothetical protein TNCV_884231 [Trichonephila clavipes]
MKEVGSRQFTFPRGNDDKAIEGLYNQKEERVNEDICMKAVAAAHHLKIFPCPMSYPMEDARKRGENRPLTRHILNQGFLPEMLSRAKLEAASPFDALEQYLVQ